MSEEMLNSSNESVTACVLIYISGCVVTFKYEIKIFITFVVWFQIN